MKKLILLLLLVPSLLFAQDWQEARMNPWIAGSAGVVASKTIAYVKSTNAASDASLGSIATSATSATAGNTLIVYVGNDTSGPVTVSSIADTAGNTFTKIDNISNGTITAELWYATNITGHANNIVTATFGSNAAWRRISVSEFSGLGTATVDTSNKCTYTGTTPSCSVTTGSAVAALKTGFTSSASVVACTVGSGYTFVDGSGTGLYWHAEYKITASTGTYNGDMSTCLSGTMAIVQGSLK